MKIYAINGGPRKQWNTATMLNSFLEGATSTGNHVETEMIHLFDLKYTGCISCFSCKRDRPSYGNGKCAVKDDLHSLLPKLTAADGIVFGSPIYFYDITAQLRGFLERLWFPYSSYDGMEEGSMFPRALPTTMIYTMNATEKQMQEFNFQKSLSVTEGWMELIFKTKPERIYAFNTYQFTDYSKYRASLFDEKAKAEWREKQFPLDCQAAFDAGKRMVEQTVSMV